jgi:hypothetical protein
MQGVDDYFASELKLILDGNNEIQNPEAEAALGDNTAEKIKESYPAVVAAVGQETHIFVHFGVHRGARGEIRLEVRGRNEAHFPDGDMNGVVRSHAPIDESQALDSCVETTLDQGALSEAASLINAETTTEEGRLAPHLRVTYDAGAYLCNYCLYRSARNVAILNETQKKSCSNLNFVSIFVHVLDPDRSDVGPSGQQIRNPTIGKQVEVLSRLLQYLAGL